MHCMNKRGKTGERVNDETMMSRNLTELLEQVLQGLLSIMRSPGGVRRGLGACRGGELVMLKSETPGVVMWMRGL